MVFINGAKYACATCIKGHRSTACQHSDRPLFAIKRKGRPISQCEHCRELRRTQKLHVKCNCAVKKKDESIAVLPQGILDDDDDEYQPTSGDKTSVEALLNPCQCLTGAECICCRPVEHYFSDCNSMQQYTTNNSINDNSSYSQIMSNSSQTPCVLPPISDFFPSERVDGYDNSKSTWEYPPSYSGNDDVPVSFTNVGSQERSYVPSDQSYSSSDIDKESTALGDVICNSTPADLAKVVYAPFQEVRGCCGSNNFTPICRCGSSCKCSGCDTHAERINFGNPYNSHQNQSEPSSSSCCSSSSYYEISQPEHTVIKDGDGVLLCGCGCQKLDTECSNCLGDLCEEYLLK